jgi:iron complex transport system ATP-binding protein
MQRVLFLSGGQIVGDGAPDEMLQDTPLSTLFDTPLRVVHANGFRQVLPA